jgi:hypothetical protein
VITTVLFGALLIARAVAGATPVRSARDRIPIIDRLLMPVGITFVVLVLLQITDLWLSNA